jgi:Cu(I)/Ag(I) efflux system membrane fusion protein
LARKTAFLVMGFALVFAASGCGDKPSRDSSKPIQEQESQGDILYWTCSMHPQIKQPKPGKCPLCAMDLIPVSKTGPDAGEGPREITLSETAIKLAEIAVAPVRRQSASTEIRMVGKITYDETRLAYISAWVSGRIDRLFVNFTGTQVTKGEPMVLVYSPELVSAQEEYLIALKSGSQRLIDASRKKLLLLGINERQIAEIEKERTAKTHLTIYAPISGVVIQKNGLEGMYVETGTQVYALADLSQVWVMLDAYESDLAWLKKNQKVAFETEAYPGQVFDGTIVFIDPFLDPKTRTVKVRVNVANPAGKLKPEMFVRAVIKTAAEVKTEGRTGDASPEAALVIPVTAPLITGKRAVVYVEVPGKKGTFEGREVVLGPRSGDFYLVREGLSEGDRVVVNGSFKIDSAVQILAKPSMMNPDGGVPQPAHGHGEDLQQSEGVKEKKTYKAPDEFKKQMDAVFAAYFEIQQALSQDRFEGAQQAAKKLDQSLNAVEMRLLKGAVHEAWMQEANVLRSSAQEIAGAKNIEAARTAFNLLSDSLYAAAKQFGTSGSQTILRFHCPMAAGGKGAYWLQNKPGTENPYYGSSMFACGDQVETVSPGQNKGPAGGKAHE